MPAIEETIAAGINVNVTLLFSVESYSAIAEAYIRGMERRHEAGESLDVHSVASFFVSRVDTEVDKRLAELGKEELRGIAAVANARAAYMRFKELFRGERYATLLEAGAPVQRPLWASTGVKDPLYPETKYVDSLVAPDTVNTMPMPTLLACAEAARGDRRDGGPGPVGRPGAPRRGRHRHGRRDEDAAPAGHRQVRRALRRPDRRHRAGARGDRHRAAEDDQVRRSRTTSSRRSSSASAPPRRESVAKRVWAHDESLWGGPGVAGDREPARLARTISDKMLEHAERAAAQFAEAAKADGLEHAVLLGMGGSSLGPEVIRRSYGDVPGGMRLHVLDSTDPGAVLATERAIDLDKTLFIVSSKSGGTIETLSHMRYFFERTGGDGSRFCAVTDPGSPLVELARERGFRRVFENDPDIGGRYSVLSYFGLVPAALAGVNIEGMLRQAQVAEQNCAQYGSFQSNSGLWLGCVMGELAQQGRDKLTYRGLGADLELRALGRAADRRVDRQAGQGHPARGGRAARATGGLRRRPRLRLPPQRGRAGRRAGREDRGARPGRPPHHDRAGDRRRRRTSGGSSSSPSSPPPWRAGRSGSTRSTSRTCRRRRTTPARILKEGLPDVDPGLARRPAREGVAAEVHRDPRLRDAVGGVRRRGHGPAGGAARAHEVHDHVRLRPALPPLDRASTTRAARRTACSSSSTSRRRTTWRSPRRATRSST